jgi:hypothetical protein
MKQIHLLLVIISISFLNLEVKATIYYVDDIDPTNANDIWTPTVVGSSTGTGTITNPNTTVTGLMTYVTFLPGDIVRIDAGTYVDEIKLESISGTSGNTIQFIGAGVAYTNLITPGGGIQTAIRLDNSSYILFQNFKITGTTVASDFGIKIYNNSDYNEINGLSIYNVLYGIDILTATFTNPSISVGAANANTTLIPEYNQIHNCYMETASVGIRIKCPSSSENPGSVAQCQYGNATNPCSLYGPRSNSIFDNVIIDVGNSGVSYACIEMQALGFRNDFYRNKLIIQSGVTTTGGGIYMGNNVVGTVFTNNYIINLSTSGANNYGVYIDPTAARSYQMDFIHNSIYTMQSCFEVSGGAPGFTMVNNILYSVNGFCLDFGTLVSPNAAATAMKESRNNLYYYPKYATAPTIAGLANYNSGTVVSTVAAWQTYNIDDTYSDAYSIGGSAAANDPQFVNPSAYLLDIPNTSPAVDNTYVLGTGDPGNGTNGQITSPNFVPVINDIYQTARPVGIRKDIGAFENLTPLPIELLEFKGDCNDGDVLLTWATASEKDNDHFTIEASRDAIIFDAIGIVNGAINSTVIRTYSYQIKNSDYNYFMLKQTDINGTTTDSKIITSNCTAASDIMHWQSGTDLYIQVPAHLNDKACKLMFYSVVGQELGYMEFPYDDNAALYIVPLSGFASGIYPSKIVCGNKMTSFKLIQE